MSNLNCMSMFYINNIPILVLSARANSPSNSFKCWWPDRLQAGLTEPATVVCLPS